MKLMELNRQKIDLTPIKIFLYLIAIYIAYMTSLAAAAITELTLDRRSDAIVTSELKSCPVPYSADYCSKEDALKSCQTSESSWPPILNKHSLHNYSIEPICPAKNTSANHDSYSAGQSKLNPLKTNCCGGDSGPLPKL